MGSKLYSVEMVIKDLGAQVESVWEGLRPMTKKLLVGALQSPGISLTPSPAQQFFYDARADWEVSRLLSALDEQSVADRASSRKAMNDEVQRLAETCVRVLEHRSASAEVFIQLAERAIKKHDYKNLDKLADVLAKRYASAEIAEIVRQTELAQIRAIAYETLAMLPVSSVAPLLDDPLYSDIAANALEQKAFEYESEEAREVLEQFENTFDAREE
jgi:hypothetical protein